MNWVPLSIFFSAIFLIIGIYYKKIVCIIFHRSDWKTVHYKNSHEEWTEIECKKCKNEIIF